MFVLFVMVRSPNWMYPSCVHGNIRKISTRRGGQTLFYGIWTYGMKVIDFWVIFLVKFGFEIGPMAQGYTSLFFKQNQTPNFSKLKNGTNNCFDPSLQWTNENSLSYQKPLHAILVCHPPKKGFPETTYVPSIVYFYSHSNQRKKGLQKEEEEKRTSKLLGKTYLHVGQFE